MRKLGLFSSALAMCIAGLAAPQAYAKDPRPGVKIRALEKITGEATDIEFEIDETVQFGGLGLTVRACYQSPPEEQPPESVAYLEVISMGINENTGTAKEDDPRLFSGWMFASSPGLNALEHSLYDVWVISCSAALPGSENEALELYDEAGLGFEGDAASSSGVEALRNDSSSTEEFSSEFIEPVAPPVVDNRVEEFSSEEVAEVISPDEEMVAPEPAPSFIDIIEIPKSEDLELRPSTE